MLEKLAESAAELLREAGLPAYRAFPREAVERGGAFIAVGIRRASGRGAGFARYLGVEPDAERGGREVYGLRCDVELALDIYAPMDAENGAAECGQLFDAAAAALGAAEGLSVRELRCGEAAPDARLGMFVLRGAADCAALLVDESGGDGDGKTFTDFVLKGELKR